MISNSTSTANWGFFAHRMINHYAVFLLPQDMLPLYRRQIVWLTDAATDPDRRRYVVENEAACHYIDLDRYDSLPIHWTEAVALYSKDTLYSHGIVPWKVDWVRKELTQAFRLHDGRRILTLSADLGHYIADAHVPLHTTKNYNGQLTGQEGIHAFWESRLPELFSDHYDLFTGKARYLPHPLETIWQIVNESHRLVDSVLSMEREARSMVREDRQHGIERRGSSVQHVYTRSFAYHYNQLLHNMVERRLKQSILLVASFWYTSWVDAGQPDLENISFEVLPKVDWRFKIDSLHKEDSTMFIIPGHTDEDRKDSIWIQENKPP